MVAAYDEAIAWINADKRRAAKFYLDISKEKMSLEDILLAPDYVFGQTPHRVGASIDMMQKAGILKTKPQSWKDMYFPEAHSLDGT